MGEGRGDVALTVGSLFSGIGGFDLGLERAGFIIKWKVEIDAFATKVLERHWPHVTRYTDIRSVDWSHVEPVDLVCGGFPCQDLSFAGHRAGIDGERSGLWSEYVRCIRALRPQFILVENVPGLLTNAYMGRVLGDLAESGYDAEWTVLSAACFGAPQLRERVWVLAYPNSHRLETDANEEVLRLSSIERETKRYLGSMGRSDEWTQARPLGARPMGVGNGIPEDVDRLKCLGNAIVPQIAEALGRMILDVHP